MLYAERGILFPSTATVEDHEVTLLQNATLEQYDALIRVEGEEGRYTGPRWRLRIYRMIGKTVYINSLISVTSSVPFGVLPKDIYIKAPRFRAMYDVDTEVSSFALDVCLLDDSMKSLPQWWRLKNPSLQRGGIQVESQDMTVAEDLEWGSSQPLEMLKEHWAEPYVDSMLEHQM